MKPVREAASVVVFNQLEQILFVKRPKTAKAWANMMVFPGGKVDISAGTFFNAAIRELFEEVDVSLTSPRLWSVLDDADRRTWRHRIVDDKDDFESLLRRTKCLPQHDELVPFSHVITPEGSPHRFDTWFFLARIAATDMPHKAHGKEDAVQPSQDVEPAPSRPRRVAFTGTSVAVSCLFLINLVVMPLKPYLTEPLPVSEAFRAPSLFPAVAPPLASTNGQQQQPGPVAQFERLYNAGTLPPDVSYFYDPVHVVEVMRTGVSSTSCDDADALVTSVLGVPFFPPDVKSAIVDAVCSLSSNATNNFGTVGRSWRIYLGAKKVDCLSAAWAVMLPAHNSTTSNVATIYYVFAPHILSPAWIIAKLSYRLVVSVCIFVYSVYRYYRPLWHLRWSLQRLPLHVSSTAVRYDVVVGEPTCLVLSNAWVCLAFVVDFWGSTEFFGSACLRMGQTNDIGLFVLGVLYLGRTVWCAYASLVVLNATLKRLHMAQWAVPANTTTLAIAVTVGGGFLTSVQVKLPPLMAFYTWLLTLVNTVDGNGNVVALDDTAAMVVYVVGMTATCFGIVLGKKYVGQSVARRRSHLRHRVCTGGSVYRIFQLFPMVQAQCTISQTGSDCYVFAYNAADELIEVTRVSLVDQIDLTQKTTARPVHQTFVETAPAVGSLVLGREKEGAADVTLYRGANNSPWVA
ncbi:hypothetical protein DYB30_004021 [Aphanomyces astaci]|uniref:Nudix hydrolase domain-containing protein n=1 Tax=Aphanomyces astaci TaxID=112090 RepID=A0A397AYF2_APHAT|nr:hypothetical protein DYB36_002357 [Aphanomyces astaci]RHY47037.1 hypothetical protein DYB34_001799 [Aphanomyces astaci]RHY74321.1 hypothetical protein DYB30_004021 [Aphanomyces astaci]